MSDLQRSAGPSLLGGSGRPGDLSGHRLLGVAPLEMQRMRGQVMSGSQGFSTVKIMIRGQNPAVPFCPVTEMEDRRAAVDKYGATMACGVTSLSSKPQAQDSGGWQLLLIARRAGGRACSTNKPPPLMARLARGFTTEGSVLSIARGN